jgi:uncharacterized protein (DUF934 family)
MSVIVTGTGPTADDWAGAEFTDLAALDAGADLPQNLPEAGLAVDLGNDQSPEALAPHFGRIALVRVAFPAMGDGRGFSIARRLRALGFTGRLRAAGPMIPDQLRAALRVGFDEIELFDDAAARRPTTHWQVREQGSYRQRLLG